MSKVFLAMFGGTPARGELCMYLNAAAGLYENCDGIQCYPIDKDTGSPNYVNARKIYNQYDAFSRITRKAKVKMASVGIIRGEEIFKDMLDKAGIGADGENVRLLLADPDNGFTGGEERLLNVCFTEAEQKKPLKGGYYGKANIGSIAGDILIQNGIYAKIKLCSDIDDDLEAGHDLDVVVVCSSFGGTGASLGINFGEYLREKYKGKENLHIHCIYIQPYFSFPDPEEDDEWKMDYKEFYQKSATVVTVLGQRKGLIKNDDQDAVFDSFYYLGQEVLDKTSDTNSAVGGQKNSIHMVDMLVSLAVEDILERKNERGPQLYAYQYSDERTETLTWAHMPKETGFKRKHICMMRFCAFMLDCIMPLFSKNYRGYETEALIIRLYGGKGRGASKTADITESAKEGLHEGMDSCFAFCKSYIEYWIQLEETTKFGAVKAGATEFFNLDELHRILKDADRDDVKGYEDIRYNFRFSNLLKSDISKDHGREKNGLDIYDNLNYEKRLKGIAAPGKGGNDAAAMLVMAVYEQCDIRDMDEEKH